MDTMKGVCEARIKNNISHLDHREVVALNLEKIADAIADAPDFDVRRIETARKALALGTLRIDPDRIAKKLIEMDTILGRAYCSD